MPVFCLPPSLSEHVKLKMTTHCYGVYSNVCTCQGDHGMLGCSESPEHVQLWARVVTSTRNTQQTRTPPPQAPDFCLCGQLQLPLGCTTASSA
eukprot:1159320-Pelagomonas_calceolata.AAC.15